MMPDFAFATASFRPSMVANCGLVSVRPTPSTFRSKVWVPVSGLPSSTDFARAYTEPPTSLVAEVRMRSLYLARASCLYWSESTPIAQTPALAAASMTPCPDRPAAWYTTSAFFSIWPSAAARPLSGLEKPPSSAVCVRYWETTFTLGSVSFTPCSKPASNLWMSGTSTPPTKPTVFVLVAFAAATPAR